MPLIFFLDIVPCEIDGIEVDLKSISKSQRLFETILCRAVGEIYAGEGDFGILTVVAETGCSPLTELLATRSK
jgi:hypothetical protein